ncbi:MAG: hypothetical protein WCL18_08060 [bacterium]
MKKELKNLLIWEVGLGVLLTISLAYFPSRLSLRELWTIHPDSLYTITLMWYKVLQLFCMESMIAIMIYIVATNAPTTIRANVSIKKKALFIATIKFIQRPYIVWIIRTISIPVFAGCAFGIFACPKPCDTTFIDTPIRIVWGEKGYSRWKNFCLRMHYRVVYACK